MRPAALWMLVLAAGLGTTLAGGCIRHHPAGPEVQQALAYLSADPFPSAETGPVQLGERSVPAVWVVRRVEQPPEDMRRHVMDQVNSGAQRVVVPASIEQAQKVVRALAQAREVMLRVRSLTKVGPSPQRRRWARNVASTLVGLENLIRQAEGTGQALLGSPDQPEVLQAVSAVIRDRLREELFGPLSPEEPRQLRWLLSGVILRVSFALARKVPPDGLQDEVASALAEADQIETLQAELERRLGEALEQAEPAPENDQLRQAMERALSLGPPALGVARTLVGQWDRFDSIELEYRKLADRPVVAMTSRITPGRQVRVGGGLFEPQLVLSGQVRMVFEPPVQRGDWARVHFVALGDDSAVSLRFSGVEWALVRLLAIPVEDLELREIRIASGRDGPRRYQTVQVYAVTARPGDDRRRMLCFQQESIHPMVRGPMELTHPAMLTTTTFSYVRPDRQYVFRHVTKGKLAPASP